MPTQQPKLRIFDDPDELARGAAEEFAERVASKVESGECFTVALSGGSTPKRLYKLLAGEPYLGRVPWQKVHFFWGDERAVPPNHPDSNFGAAYETLLAKISVPPGNIHRIRAELGDPAEAAADYEDELRRFFRLSDGEFPRLDLVFLGMGTDGHTASLFPGSEALAEARRLVVAPWLEKLEAHRVSLTCPVFNNAACTMFLVSGEEKSETLRLVLEGPDEPAQYPAQLIRPEAGELVWYLDRSAGRTLRRERG